jgi:hypothetical protein
MEYDDWRDEVIEYRKDCEHKDNDGNCFIHKCRCWHVYICKDLKNKP